MVEKIKLLSGLSRVQLIKLLNVEEMSLNNLLDFFVEINEQLENKYDKISKIELKNQYNGFYDMQLSDDISNTNLLGLRDLIQLIDIEDMDYCELLYFNVIIYDEIEKRRKKYNKMVLDDNYDKFSFQGNLISASNKINFVNAKDIMIGVDKFYNFYLGKINENRECVLICVMRNGLPYDLSHDKLVFYGNVDDCSYLNGMWMCDSKSISKGISILKNMSNDYDKYEVGYFNNRDLELADITCNEFASNIDVFLNKFRINNDRVNVKKR